MKQIAGRAGRASSDHGCGYATTLFDGDVEYLKDALAQDLPKAEVRHEEALRTDLLMIVCSTLLLSFSLYLFLISISLRTSMCFLRLGSAILFHCALLSAFCLIVYDFVVLHHTGVQAQVNNCACTSIHASTSVSSELDPPVSFMQKASSSIILSLRVAPASGASTSVRSGQGLPRINGGEEASRYSPRRSGFALGRGRELLHVSTRGDAGRRADYRRCRGSSH